jgi:hypothetical protein
MTWRRVPVCFRLLSGLHVGFLPNGAGTVVARTRCYVPAKTFWGALTARLTQRLVEQPARRDYEEIGKLIQRYVRPSYWYLSDGKRLFTPDFGAQGLQWAEELDRRFRANYLDSRVSTSVGERGIAVDATLHEIEFVRRSAGMPGGSATRVYLAGVVWAEETDGDHPVRVAEDTVTVGGFDVFDGIVLGGNRKYGFGRIEHVPVPSPLSSALEERWPVEPDAVRELDEAQPLLSHAIYRPDIVFQGAIELLAGREYGENGKSLAPRPGMKQVNDGYFYAPGTHLTQPPGLTAHRDHWCRIVWTAAEERGKKETRGS